MFLNRQQRFVRGCCWIFCGIAVVLDCFGLFLGHLLDVLDFYGSVWVVVGRCELFSRSFCVAVGFCGSLWVVVGRCKLYFGLLWVVVDNFGSLQIVVDGCGVAEDGFWSLWIILGRCRLLWTVVIGWRWFMVVVDCFGSFLVLANKIFFLPLLLKKKSIPFFLHFLWHRVIRWLEAFTLNVQTTFVTIYIADFVPRETVYNGFV